MAMIDPEQERRRVAEFYSHQMDGALKCWSSRKRVKHFPASQLTTPLLLDALAETVPLSTTRSEEIAPRREWGGNSCGPSISGGRTA
jgi:hypothetical protein